MPAFAATWGRFLVFARRGSPEIRAPGRRRMAKTPADLLYSKSHEWVKLAGNEATIGITDHAQEALNDIVYVELPKVGQSFAQEEEFGVVESVKSVSDLYMPIAGEVTAVNSALEDAPETLNDDPYGQGWLVKVKVKDPAQAKGLLSAKAYEAETANH
jgi:glycine cleavage system H protein